MDRITLNGISLFIGEIPGRKRKCIYFIEEPLDCASKVTPIGYVEKQYLEDVERLWLKFTGWDKPVIAKDGSRYKTIGAYIDDD